MIRKILLLAGEESGLMYADAITRVLRRRIAGVEIRGYADCGFAVADMAVMGFTAVVSRLGYFMRVERIMKREIAEWRPDVVCTIDYPGMNLRLAAYAKSLGIRTVHVVCPQVWAWKKGRIPRIVASLDKLLCFFPFEPALFPEGFAEFVGHPLADSFAALRRAMPHRAARLVAILPGSRLGEIERNLPTLLEAAAQLDCVKVCIPAANKKALAEIQRIVEEHGAGSFATVSEGGARRLLLSADVAAVASGTATLEAALARCPTVLVYRVNWFFAFLARRLIKGVKHIGLANIIWEKAHPDATPESFPMPELLQENFTPAAVANRLRNWLDNPAERDKAASALAAACRLLSPDAGAIERIAGRIAEP